MRKSEREREREGVCGRVEVDSSENGRQRLELEWAQAVIRAVQDLCGPWFLRGGYRT